METSSLEEIEKTWRFFNDSNPEKGINLSFVRMLEQICLGKQFRGCSNMILSYIYINGRTDVCLSVSMWRAN